MNPVRSRTISLLEPACLGVRLEIDDTDRGTLVVNGADHRSRRLGVELEVCPSPTCGCREVKLVADPDDSPGGSEPVVLHLDIGDRRVTPGAGAANLSERNLARWLAAGLSDAHWRQLTALFHAAKRHAMEHVDLDSLRVVFPPEVDRDGLMVAYTDIFPFAEPLLFTLDGERWLVDDQYCVLAHCRCAATTLCLFRVTDLPLTDGTAADPRLTNPVSTEVAVRYDLRRRRWTLEDDPPASRAVAASLMTAFAANLPDGVAVLTERRRQLRHLYRRWLASQAPSPPARAARRPGRNDPCPCGSGKKLKRCCGR